MQQSKGQIIFTIEKLDFIKNVFYKSNPHVDKKEFDNWYYHMVKEIMKEEQQYELLLESSKNENSY
jgi:ribonucleotide reductase beta subunit family protein with ferritin-like domain